MPDKPNRPQAKRADATLESAKGWIKKLLPGWLLRLRGEYLTRKEKQQHAQRVFTRIYEQGTWGKSSDPAQRFYSGSGSHDADIVGTYVGAILEFLSSLAKKPDAVDLGCGDFSVGTRVRHLCGKYIACDIVKPVIAWNRQRFKDDNVDFRVLDITRDKLPGGDIAFLRQVLQHLSNEQIQRAVGQIAARYKYLVLTEHLPASDTFAHNLDKPVGGDIRLGFNSGIVLTSAPFNLQVQEAVVLCEVAESDGIIRTILYRLA